MEIGLKERLIGAVVLVLLGVIIIPLFLKGSPSSDQGANQAVSLPASSATAPIQQYTLPLNGAPASGTAPLVPASTAAPAVAATVASKPAVHTITRSAAPAPAAAPAATGKWVVQAGSYGSEANAVKVEKLLAQHGFHAAVSRIQRGGQTLYRVRVGPYAQRADADKALPAVARAYGGKAEVVPND